MTDPRREEEELVSAYLDGELTPEQRARVQADPVLSVRVEELRLAAALVATPVQPPPEARREAAVRAALDASHAAEPGTADLAERRDRRRRTAVGSWLAVAAAVVAVLAIGASLLRSGERNERASTPASTPAAPGVGGSATALGQTAQGTLAAPADLGTFNDDASLANAARGALELRATAGGAPSTAPAPARAESGTAADQASCAQPDPAGGAVVLDASATLRGTRVRVIVQRDSAGAQRLTVLAGCEIILQRPL